MVKYLGIACRKLHIPLAIDAIIAKMLSISPAEKPIADKQIYEKLNSIHPDTGASAISTENEVDTNARWDVQVIIPVYNTAQTVGQCVDSILAQKGEHKILLTIVNDGSSDNSREVLRKYEALPNVEIIDQKNKGHSGARNAGLRHIKARYVTFVDSDDWIPDNAIDSLLTLADSTDSDIVQGSFSYVSLEGKPYGANIVQDRDFDGQMLGFTCGKLVKSQLFKNIIFPENYWFEDSIYAFLLFPMTKKKASTSVISYCYRSNPAGISVTSKRRIKSLDSFYITASLYKDRVRLGIPFTQSDYEHFLHQVTNNHRRAQWACNRQTHKLLMAGHQNMRQAYFSGFRTADPRLKIVERALDDNKLNPLIFACNL